jgi:predicted AlkP superfamily phosphohydrolase/phosphomutase
MLAFLQFDASSVDLIERMLVDGRLPTLSALRKRGTLGPLEASSSSYEGAIYPELYTGVDVGDHALYSAFSWSPQHQRARPWLAVPKPAAVWERLARAGRRSLVIDPYQGWPGTDGEGLWVSGWQFQNRMVLPRWSVPHDAFGALMRDLGPPPAAETVFGRPSPSTLLALRRAFMEAPARTAALVERALARETFDFAWITFSCVHLAGHYLWDRALVAHVPLEPETRTLLDEAVADVYAATDAALGRIVEALPAGTDLVVFSPDGMGPNTSRSDLLPGMLAAILDDGADGGGTGAALWRWRATIPMAWRAAAARMLPEATVHSITAWLQTASIDWARTRAFALPGDCHGFVRLNLRGRERDGIVDPGEAEPLLDRIADGLATFCDPDGSPAVDAVERTPDAIRRGAAAHLLPDLVVRWTARPTATLSAVASPRFGRVARHGAGPGLAGNHTEGAWSLLVAGSGHVAASDGSPRLVDLAATACAHAGVPALDLSGRPLIRSTERTARATHR